MLIWSWQFVLLCEKIKQKRKFMQRNIYMLSYLVTFKDLSAYYRNVLPIIKCVKCVAWPSIFLFRMIDATSGGNTTQRHWSSSYLEKLNDILKELHGSHYIFILLINKTDPSDARVAVRKVSQCDDELTFWQVSMNSSIVTTPSLLRSIF